MSLGDVSRAYPRRVLLAGAINAPDWRVSLQATARERDELRQWKLELERVTPESAAGKLTLGVSHELELVSEETAAWLSLARKDLERAEQQLEAAEAHLRRLSLCLPGPSGVAT